MRLLYHKEFFMQFEGLPPLFAKRSSRSLMLIHENRTVGFSPPMANTSNPTARSAQICFSTLKVGKSMTKESMKQSSNALNITAVMYPYFKTLT